MWTPSLVCSPVKMRKSLEVESHLVVALHFSEGSLGESTEHVEKIPYSLEVR